MTTIKGKIVTEDEVFEGTVTIEEGLIKSIQKDDSTDSDFDFSGQLIVPGFIDVHMHGLDNYGMFKSDDIAEAALLEIKFGTTGFLPTVASCTHEQYLEHPDNIAEARKKNSGNGAKILGSHFEGPFINIDKKGGMDADYLVPMDENKCTQYIEKAGDILKLITLSPELDASAGVIKKLVKNNTTVSIGHSKAVPEDLKSAAANGLTQACHLFNAYDNIIDREGGVWEESLVGEILLDDRIFCEIICDLHHVMPQTIKLALKTAGEDRIIAITDSMEGTGLPAGKFNLLDGRTYNTFSGAGRLSEGEANAGGLVGSVLTMNKAFENLIESCGFTYSQAAKATSLNPARSIKLADKLGSIAVGKAADLAVLDKSYNCVATFIDGKPVGNE
ncbi:MAG: N-acetylglucosamine-6-phosphate deacetylase [Planctomycetota bacterium]|jgi:N-acetylglucosamine-6-phosphate deacetylase